MTTKTAIAITALHTAHEGKTMRLNGYEALRKQNNYPTIATLRKYDAVAESTESWCYSEGENAEIAYNTYVVVTIK